jgi:arylsulfatase A-like enzyme
MPRFLLFALLAFTLASSLQAARPNILVILSDDQGYADTGFNGCKDIPTPNMDRLAADGVRCSNGYVTHAFCSPSRAALLTGRYQHRFGHENNPFYDPNDHLEGLSTKETLLPQYLQKAGYVTGWIGKWHLGAAPEFYPEARGFQETFGFLGGGHRYQDWKPDAGEKMREYFIPIRRNGQPVEVTQHLTIAFGEEGAAFVKRHTDQPWFLYLAFNAPHTPLEPTAERLARFASIPDQKRRAYAAQVSLLDDAIGAVLAAMRDSGQDERTLIFFFSDNGGPVGAISNGSSNEPLRAGKGTVYEGGIHVPFVVRWPGGLPGGRVYEAPVSSLDVFPTALAVAGVPMPDDKPHDGVNLLPFLQPKASKASANTAAQPHDALFWRLGGGTNFATRQSALKLVRIRDKADELYDLSSDLSEAHDLAGNLTGAHLTDIQRLITSLEAWNKQMIPPAFPGAGTRRQGAPPGTKATPNPKGASPVEP